MYNNQKIIIAILYNDISDYNNLLSLLSNISLIDEIHIWERSNSLSSIEYMRSHEYPLIYTSDVNEYCSSQSVLGKSVITFDIKPKDTCKILLVSSNSDEVELIITDTSFKICNRKTKTQIKEYNTPFVTYNEWNRINITWSGPYLRLTSNLDTQLTNINTVYEFSDILYTSSDCEWNFKNSVFKFCKGDNVELLYNNYTNTRVFVCDDTLNNITEQDIINNTNLINYL